jgi:predicted aspartyl protease
MNIPPVPLAGLLATLALVFAPAPTRAQEPSGPADAAAADPRDAIPSTREKSGRISVPVRLNGQGPFRFLLDTGANRSALTSRVATQLGLAVQDSRMVVQGVNGRVVAGMVRVESMQIGAVSVGEQRLPVLDGEVFEGLDGSLGADMLANLRLVADFDTGVVTISHDHSPADPAHYGVIKARRVSGWLIMAEGRARSAPFQMVLDTGAARTLGNGALYRALTGRPLSQSTAMHIAVNDATQTRGTGVAVSVSPIVLDNLLVENTTVAFGDYAVFGLWGLENKPAMLLGMDVLGSLRQLTIDYSRHELQILPPMHLH